MALFNRQSSGADRGFSLVESLVLIGLLTFLFTGIFYGFQATLVLIAENRAQVTALSLVTDRLESIRSLSYVAVGTDGGIPAGAIPQTSTTTANGIEFTERVLVEYVDDPADGVGVSDANGITTDYKRVRVSYTWNQFNSPREVVLASNIIPRSIESDVGGGTLRVNVFDAAIQPVSGAEVQVTNTTVSPAVSVVRYTNSEGVALIGGAPAASEYELLVTDTNYSTDQTHQATTTLPNPDKSPVTVVEADVTTMNFFIDELSDLLLRTRSAEVTTTEERLLQTGGGGVATTTGTVVTSTSTRLATAGSDYVASGQVFTQPIAPATIEEWGAVRLQATTTANTELRTRLYIGTSTTALVPEVDLPGNTIGFTGNIPITVLDVSIYPVLTVGIELRSVSGSTTPTVASVWVDYTQSYTPAPNKNLVLESTKRIGTLSGGEPVLKHQYAGTTNGAGEWQLTGVEWDAYAVQPPTGEVVAKACPNDPVVVDPATSGVLDLLLVPATTHSLRLQLSEPDGTPVVGATVTIDAGGTDRTAVTGSCGQVYFGGLNETDYTVAAEVLGRPDPADITVAVSGTTYQLYGL